MQSIRIRRIFPLFVPLAFGANVRVAQLKAPFGFAVNDKATLAYCHYHVQLYYLNKDTNEEQEAENCFTWGKRNPLSIHYNSVHGGIEGVTLNIKVNHYVFDFRRLKERIIRLTVACLDSTQTILQRGCSSYLKLLPKISVDNNQDNEEGLVPIAWLEDETNTYKSPIMGVQFSSEESSANEVHYSNESHPEQFSHPEQYCSGSNESSDVLDHHENIDTSIDLTDYPMVPHPEVVADDQYMVLYDGNAEVIGNFRALNFYKASDVNIKEDIRLLADDFDCRSVLLRIDGVDYKFKPGIHNNVNRRFVGYIAQQVESVVPSAVQLIDGILHVDYESLIPYLSESIRQNFNDIKKIKADNEKLRHALTAIYDAFVDAKSRDNSTIKPFTESKPARLIPLVWRAIMMFLVIAAVAIGVSAVVLLTLKSDPLMPTNPSSPVSVKSNQQVALESLFNATSGPYWKSSKNWLTEVPICEWFGIMCRDGVVYSLSLQSNNIIGTIPANISMLSDLQYLDLSRNSLFGTIPDSIATMTSLISIELSFNPNISGTVPKTVSALTTLQKLMLEEMSLTGPVLETIIGLRNITNLGLRRNRFTGTIPESIRQLSKLQEIDLTGNFFDGTLPAAIGTLSSLKQVLISFNMFTGNVPESIFKLPELQEVNLASNSLSGAIPASIGDAKSLVHLDLQNNFFSGTLPMKMCTPLLSTLLLENNVLTGTIPDSFDRCSHLTFVSLSFNQLNGTVPNSLLTNKMVLSSLYLNDNNLTGTLPPKIDTARLFNFDVSNNQLHGSVPAFNVGLSMLDLSNNAFEGTLPKLPEGLAYLLLANNHLNGTLDELNTNMKDLKVLDISHNGFIGDLSSIVLSTSLSVLNVSHNMLTTIDQIPNITRCDASFNRFKCPLPVGAERCKATCL